MGAYLATMLQSTASPISLLSLMDPLLPLSVLSKCVSAYAGKATPRAGGLVVLGCLDPAGTGATGQSPGSEGGGAEKRNLRSY